MDFDAHSVESFCDSHNISRAFFFKLCRAGKGPKLMKIGSRTLISREAAEAWRRQVEAETNQAA